MEEGGCNVVVLPHLWLSGNSPRAANLAKTAQSQVFRAGRAGSPPCGEAPVGFTPAAAPESARAPRPPRGCTKTCVRQWASVVRWERFCKLPESTGKYLPCREMPSPDNLTLRPKSRSFHFTGTAVPTDSSKLNGCGSKLDTSSLSSLPLLLSGSPGQGGSDSHATPASLAPSWLVRRAQPHKPRQRVPRQAGLPQAPGAIF